MLAQRRRGIQLVSMLTCSMLLRKPLATPTLSTLATSALLASSRFSSARAFSSDSKRDAPTHRDLSVSLTPDTIVLQPKRFEKKAGAGSIPAGGANAKKKRALVRHDATLLWLHGLGDSGHGFEQLFAQLPMGKTRVVLPTAPLRSVAVNDGAVMPAWYNIFNLTPRSLEDETDLASVENSFSSRGEDFEGVLESRESIHQLLDYERQVLADVGSDPENLFIGGFSQGAALSVFAGYTYPHKLRSVTACSGYMLLRDGFGPEPSQIAKDRGYEWEVHESNRKTPLLTYHGGNDVVVPFRWATASFAPLLKTDVPVTKRAEEGMGHEMSPEEIWALMDFWKETLAGEEES